MKIIDLTYTVSEKTPVYPGSESPRLTTVCTHEKNLFQETALFMFSHTGTHMDAPAHVIKNGAVLEAIDPGCFMGKATVIDCTELSFGGKITMEHINKNRQNADDADFLIFRTGWGKYWANEEYFTDYPLPDEEVTDYAVTQGKKGIGFDTLSPDPISGEGLKAHKKLLEKGVLIIENLANLHLLDSDTFFFEALPLKFENSDGAPVRAVAIIN